MLVHQPFNPSHLCRRHATASRQANWVQPEFAFTVAGIDMDVRRFVSFVGVEVEPQSFQAQKVGMANVNAKF